MRQCLSRISLAVSVTAVFIAVICLVSAFSLSSNWYLKEHLPLVHDKVKLKTIPPSRYNYIDAIPFNMMVLMYGGITLRSHLRSSVMAMRLVPLPVRLMGNSK